MYKAKVEKIFGLEPYKTFLDTIQLENTRRAYEKDLRKLHEYLTAVKIKPLRANKKTICDFAAYQLDLKNKISTSNHIFSVVSAFYQDMEAIDRVKVNPAVVLRRYFGTPDPIPPRQLKPTERERLVRSLKYTPFHYDSKLKNFQEGIIVMLGLHCGLRVSEMRNLLWKDVDFEAQRIFIRLSKARKNRFIPLSSTMVHDLKLFQQEHIQKHGWFHGTFVLNAQSGDKPIALNTIQKRLKSAAKNAKLTRSVNIHDLRHSFADWLDSAETPLHVISNLMGHSSPQTTSKVYLHPNEKNMRNAIKRALG